MINASAAYDTEHANAARTPIYQVILSKASFITTPTAYWKLDETSGTRDDAIGTNDLTDNNTVTALAGKLSNAAKFTKANSEYLNKTIGGGNALQMGNVPMSVCLWVYIDTLPVAFDINLAGQYTNSWSLHITSTGFFKFTVNDGVGTASVSHPTAPSTGTWYFVFAYLDTANNLLGISTNAGQVHTATASSRYAQSSTADFYLGRASDEFYDGRIDEVSVWRNLVLGPSAVLALYNGGNANSLDTWNATGTHSYCTAIPIGSDVLGNEYLEVISLERRVDAEFCRFPLSTLIFALTDVSSDVTSTLTDGIAEWDCAFHAGFWDLAWASNSVQLFQGIITEFQFNAGRYEFTARSPIAVAQDKFIFNGALAVLTSSLSNSGTSISVDDASAFATPTEDHPGIVAIDNEIIEYTKRTDTSLTGGVRVGTSSTYAVPPIIAGSESVVHASASSVRELVQLGRMTASNDDAGTNDIHPIDLLEMVLTEDNVKIGLGQRGVSVNSTQLAAARTALGDDLKFLFLMDEPVNAKGFLEQEIYLPCAAYPTENGAGEIGIKLYQAAADASSVDTLTDASITELPMWLRNAEKLINMVTYHYDYNPITQEFMSTFEYRDSDLIAQHGRELPLIIYSRGIRSAYTSGDTWFGSTAAFLTDASQRHIARFGQISPVLSVKAIFAKNLLETADDIEATLTNAVSVTGGTRDLTDAPAEIIAMVHQFTDGLIDMEVLSYEAG